jgi:hypothetical protein
MMVDKDKHTARVTDWYNGEYMSVPLMLELLCSQIDVIDEFNKHEFVKVHCECVSIITHANADTAGAAYIHGKWYPKSQLRCDPDYNIYVSAWLYDRISREDR